MGNKCIVVPIAQNHTNQCTITPPWFVQGSEYNVLAGEFELLINGENAFAAIYDAIAGAQKSVSILCWGFQPSMYFKRGTNGPGLRIGELLEEKGKQGVQVRVLSWSMEFEAKEQVTGVTVAKSSVTGFVEANAPGRRYLSVKDQPNTMSDAAFDYNQEWFMRYDTDQGLLYDQGVRRATGLDGKARTKNVDFVGRGFSAADRTKIETSERADPKTSKTTRTFQAGAASHHQKMVLVDFEDPERAQGFVMGHNMLDEYWDRCDHSCKRYDDPRIGRNGNWPREDISSRVTGPLLGDLFHNFNSAWTKETGKDLAKDLPLTTFDSYPLSAATQKKQAEQDRAELARVRQEIDREHALQDALKFDFSDQGKRSIATSKERQRVSKAQAIELEHKLAAKASQTVYGAATKTAIMGQILRTQPQYGTRDIATSYLQAVNNATQYIYIENQYFRWTPLAEKIKACATSQARKGRAPEYHGPLYLFVITNACKEGLGDGTVNTARMLDSLGRADTLPDVSRQQRVEDSEAELARAKQQSAEEQTIQRGLASTVTRTRSSTDRRRTQQQIEDSKQKQAAADQRAAALQKTLDEQRKDEKDSRRAIAPEERPGLKVHIASLVSPDSPKRRGSTATDTDKNRGLTREERADAAQKALEKNQKERNRADAECADLRMQQNQETLGRMQSPVPTPANTALDARLKAKEAERTTLAQQRDALKKELADLKEFAQPNENAAYIDWVDVYIHAKLMIIDDTFMTVGSANINSRSMETDSELNIAHANHLISQPKRKALWGLHTNNKSGGEVMNTKGMKAAYKNWGYVMERNKDARAKKLQPIASLIEFYSGTTDRTDKD